MGESEMSPHSLAPNDRCYSPNSYRLQFSNCNDFNPLNSTSAFKTQNLQTVAQGIKFAPPQCGGLLAIEDIKSRSRNMSQSSTDGEDVNDVKPLRKSSVAMSDDVELNRQHLKRKNSDAFDYPRRRATIACEICRSRKSRCDGARPKCRLCSELNAECVYREPGVKLDAGDKLILERLRQIENLIQSNIAGSASNNTTKGLHATQEHSPAATASTVNEDTLIRTSLTPSAPSVPVVGSTAMPSNGLGTWESPKSITQSTMPKNHTTPALNLLHWPKIRDLVSQRWDPQILVQLEMHREPLFFGPPRTLVFSNAHVYIEAYFKRVNVWYACVSPFTWQRYYRKAQAQGFREGAESCMALLVLALGCASTGGTISQLPPKTELPGYPFFVAAWAILPSLLMRADILAAQCQIMAAAYLFYAVRPLEAWNVLTSTSMKLQLLLSGTLSPSAKQLSGRVYWNALLFESDLLAELELPHSGIVQYEDIVGLPTHFEDGENESAGVDDLRYFLAEIALRRLLNRVSNMIYSKSSPITSTAALDPVVTGLDAELMEWYDTLPAAVQFDYDRAPLASPVQNVLRLRYFACRTIIYRPYVLAVLIKETAFLDLAVQENCRKCLEACIRQLEHITAHHAGHLPYLWQGALSIVSQALLGATMSPSLSALLPTPNQVNAIIGDVVREIQRYAHLAPSLRLAADIITQAEERRRQNLRSPSMAYVKTA
ncbi:putative phosphoribomutase [Venturia nashicola]|nr:putative phosphoribomutase [Venturia nashicola]